MLSRASPSEYEIDRRTVEADVVELLDDLRAKKLIVAR